MLLPKSGGHLCGACAHRLAVAQDLAQRIHVVAADPTSYLRQHRIGNQVAERRLTPDVPDRYIGRHRLGEQCEAGIPGTIPAEDGVHTIAIEAR